MFVASLVGAAVEIYDAQSKKRAVVKVSGRLAGAAAGAAGGARLLGKWGARFGWIGAAAGVFAGGLLGGAGGAVLSEKTTEYVYDLIVEPLEVEEEWEALTPDQVEPTTPARTPR